MNFAYPVKIEFREDRRFKLDFRDIPCSVTAKSLPKAIASARKKLEKHIKATIETNKPLAEPSGLAQGDILITLDAHIAAKAALHVAFQNADLSKSALAKELKVDNKEIRRMLSFESPTKLPRIIEALNILGYNLSVSLEPAA